jgi:hypothetical protein
MLLDSRVPPKLTGYRSHELIYGVKSAPLIFAFGFDAAGFAVSSDVKDSSVAGCELRYIKYRDNVSLAAADAVIFMSGIFETQHSTDAMGGWHRWVDCDEHHLALREKEIFQLLKKGGWAGILLRKVENGDAGKWAKTDLAKRLLNGVFKNVFSDDPNPHVTCRRDEFREYLERYGISETTFSCSREGKEPVVIADTRSGIAAAEAFGEFFFLPLRQLNHDPEELRKAVSLCALAITNYVSRNRIYLPEWAEKLEFQTEISLRAESETIDKRLLEIDRSLQSFRSYKAILTSSGDKLRELVIDVLRDYFRVSVTERDNNIEDTLINSDSKTPLFVVEIKGVRGGLKREHVNQVDSHRERLGLTADTAGLLILNDFMEVEGVEKRAGRELEAQHLKHAANLHVHVLRTTTLFEIMLRVERWAPESRAAELLRVCSEKTLVAATDVVEL